jgi:pyridoxamine 5'-phosphate oxidase-like protein
MTTRHASSVVDARREDLTDAIRERVWHALAKASFAVVGYVTPSGEPRSSGVVYKVIRGRMYVAVGRDSWKARHIAAGARVTVTATVPRGGILSLFFPIPPATISFQGTALVYPADAPQARSAIDQLKALLPEEGRDTASIIEIVPEGSFVTYGVGVPLMKMRDPVAARARVPVARVAGEA